jgi:hypothetical protein
MLCQLRLWILRPVVSSLLEARVYHSLQVSNLSFEKLWALAMIGFVAVEDMLDRDERILAFFLEGLRVMDASCSRKNQT